MADFSAEVLASASALASLPAVAEAIPAEIFIGAAGGGAVVAHYLMRGRDSLASYLTWAAPMSDPNGTAATPGNTTPPLVGVIVPGSGVILDFWES